MRKNLLKTSCLAALLGLALVACGGGGSSDDDDILAGDGGGSSGGGGGGGSAGSVVVADFHTLRTPALPAGQFDLISLSTLPDTVTNSDVLIALRGLSATAPFSVTRNGTDVSSAFQRLAGGEIRGLVSGLAVGTNTLVATSGSRSARLVVKNHPITGPVISGPHQTPFYCRLDDAGLEPDPSDRNPANCSALTKYQWFYRSSQTQGFIELANPYASYPSDAMQTQTVDGRAVPFVVRVESRTINRGIARISVLDDPAARGPDAPFAATQWNNRIYYVYGESCGVGYQQGNNDPSYVLGALDLTTVSADKLLINLVGVGDRLGKGDAIVHSTLSAFGVHCNPLVSIETTMMIKEHISEQYGLVAAVVGTNGSGAALQQYNAANNAPGLLTAAMPTATFADIPSTAMTVTDCGLLQHYYENTPINYSDQKKAAINGHNLLVGNQFNAICQSWTDAFFDRVVPESCPGQVPDEDRYDPVNNRDGVRCTIQDANVNIYGRDPATGFAYRPLDNVGVQYGLSALNTGAINFAEFLDLNRNIGGLDIDGRFTRDQEQAPAASRHAMAPEIAALTYRVGGVIGRGALSETPVLDLAPYLDLIPVANIHEAIRPFTVRARLDEYDGQHVTQALWRGVVTQADAYPAIEEWFTAVQAARPNGVGDRAAHQAAVTSTKPAGLADRCSFGTIGGRLELPSALLLPLGLAQFPLLPGAGVPGVNIPLRVDVPEDFNAPLSLGPCGVLLPVTRTPRMVAGMPLRDDVLKCQLKEPVATDYTPALSTAQLAEVQAIFPAGVCDYSQPGVGALPAGQHSLLWTSIGGATLEAPHELKWRVARSN